MPRLNRFKSVIGLLVIAVMSGLMMFDFPSGDERTTVATLAMGDAMPEDSMSSGEGGAEAADGEEMSDPQFFRIAFILIASIVCFFIGLKVLVNFWIIVTGMAAFGLIFTMQDLSVALAVVVSLVMLGLSGLFGGGGDRE